MTNMLKKKFADSLFCGFCLFAEKYFNLKNLKMIVKQGNFIL